MPKITNMRKWGIFMKKNIRRIISLCAVSLCFLTSCSVTNDKSSVNDKNKEEIKHLMLTKQI